MKESKRLKITGFWVEQLEGLSWLFSEMGTNSGRTTLEIQGGSVVKCGFDKLHMPIICPSGGVEYNRLYNSAV